MASSLVANPLVSARLCLGDHAQELRKLKLGSNSVGAGVVHGSFRGAKLAINSRPAFREQRERTIVCGLFGLGVPEVVVIVAVGAILFGPKKLPELGKSLGKTVKSFQTAAKEFETEIKAGAAEAEVEKVETPKPATAVEDKKPAT